MINLTDLDPIKLLKNMPTVEQLDSISLEIAQSFCKGKLSFKEADRAMNSIYGYIVTDEFLSSNGQTLPELTFAVFEAFDQGEYHHSNDDKSIDPQSKYTLPLLQETLRKYTKNV